MEDIDTSQLPNKLVKKAIQSYRFNQSADIQEKIQIQQWKYNRRHGDFSLYSSQDDQYVKCSVRVNGETYTRNIPKIYEDINIEMYPIGQVKFKRVELMAVSAVNGFPWANEAFSAFYWGTMDFDSIDNNSEWYKNNKILQQYYPPCSVISEPPECTVLRKDNKDNNKFLNSRIRYATHCKAPNPWSNTSFGVLYENENIANKLLTHEDVYGENDKFNLTPPESLTQPRVIIR